MVKIDGGQDETDLLLWGGEICGATVSIELSDREGDREGDRYGDDDGGGLYGD